MPFRQWLGIGHVEREPQTPLCGVLQHGIRVGHRTPADVDDESTVGERRQERIVDAVLGGDDVLAVMPTGSGKSLCYQLPAVVLPGVTIVVSPLISLMKDQVDELNRRGVAAGSLHSMLDSASKRDVIEAARRGALRLLYVAPERFASNAFTQLLAGIAVYLASDESAFTTISGYLDGVRGSRDAKILAGGGVDRRTGWFVEPTVLQVMRPDLPVMCEEIFGPVLSVYVYDHAKLDDTLELCDRGSPYALTGAIFARDSLLWHPASECHMSVSDVAIRQADSRLTAGIDCGFLHGFRGRRET